MYDGLILLTVNPLLSCYPAFVNVSYFLQQYCHIMIHNLKDHPSSIYRTCCTISYSYKGLGAYWIAGMPARLVLKATLMGNSAVARVRIE